MKWFNLGDVLTALDAAGTVFASNSLHPSSREGLQQHLAMANDHNTKLNRL